MQNASSLDKFHGFVNFYVFEMKFSISLQPLFLAFFFGDFYTLYCVIFLVLFIKSTVSKIKNKNTFKISYVL